MSIDRIQEQHDIAERTKENYVDVLERVLSGMGKPIEWIILHPNATYDWYKTNVSASTESKLMLASAVNKMTQIYSGFALKHAEHVQRWREMIKESNKAKREKYRSHKMAETKYKKAVMYEELKNVYCKLSKDATVMTRSMTSHMRFILLTMLLSIKPKRADLGTVYVAVDKAVPEEKKRGNYIEIQGKTGKLYLNRYKTAKTYGTLEETLPVTTVNIIRKSLTVEPREYLLVNTKGEPYTNKDYSKFFTRMCEHHFGKGMCATIWRSVFVSENVDFNLDPLILEENARLMGHSVAMQMAVYRTTHAQIKKRPGKAKVTPNC